MQTKKSNKAESNNQEIDIENQSKDSEDMSLKIGLIIKLVTNFAVVCAFISLAGSYIIGGRTAWTAETYKLTNDGYAIVYQNSKNYWLVAAEEQDDILLLDSSKQKIISVEGVPCTIKEFSDVQLNNGNSK